MIDTCEDFIVEELLRAGIDYGYTKNDITVSCPYHTHSGTKKKLGFKRESRQGAMYCWVCGVRGKWNDYAEKMGLRTIDTKTTSFGDYKSLRNKIKRDERSIKSKIPGLPEGAELWTGEWRGLSENFLATIPSFKWYDKNSKAYRILWPVFMQGRMMGCTSYNLDENTMPKTRNLGGLKMNRCLFPFDHYLIKDGVVLVEGQYDALRLLGKGIPALAILGTNQWDDEEGESGDFKANLLLKRGIKRVVVAMDGDEAGYQCAKKILKTLNRYRGIESRFMDFPDPPEGSEVESYDPGNCPTKYLKLMNRMLR